MKTRTVVASTLASLAFLASTVVATGNAQPLPHLLHLHPGTVAQTDDRISLHLYNDSTLFKDVTVAGKTYTLEGHQALGIKAPAGTLVYAASNMPLHRRGEVVLTIAQNMQDQKITIK